MIRIRRGGEPEELEDERAARLPALRRKVEAQSRIERRDLKGYQQARVALYVGQHRKCAYCEDSMKMPYEPVEHFRPAIRALRGPSYPEHGYWWLAWTWENLLFACSICNSSHKRDHFPLYEGSAVMSPEDQLPSPELAVLVDPADPLHPDPTDLIVFWPVGDRWVPTGRNGDPRGAEIVRLLGLDGPAHLPRYKQHVDEHLLPHVDRLRHLVETGDVDGFQREWALAVRHVRPMRAWAALAHDVLDHYFPGSLRAQMDVALPRPSA